VQNIFEMLAFASTIAFPRPEQFKYPATISATAVGLAGVLYAMFVRSRRGHLLHLSNCVDPRGQKDHRHWWMFEMTRRSRFHDQEENENDEAEESNSVHG
jgi:iron-regulated transporter 1